MHDSQRSYTLETAPARDAATPWYRQALTGWGRHAVQSCLVARPGSEEHLRRLAMGRSGTSYIARGLGRAYGDAALNQNCGVVLMTACNRFLKFNRTVGTITCESGVSLEEIIRVVLPHGYFLPTTPGTKHVTIGGAIAADVHGKNHHVDGSFGQHVLELQLLTASGEVANCSPQQNRDLFWATVGGMGLTGIILSAEMRLLPVQSGYVRVHYRRTHDLDQTLDYLDATDAHYRYSVAWIDGLARGRKLGRCVVMQGEHAAVEELPAKLRLRPLQVQPDRRLMIPVGFAGRLLNRWTARLFNSTYYKVHSDRTRYVDYDSFFYPLDKLTNWNRLYGRQGFLQYQALVPSAGASDNLIRLFQCIEQSRQTPFLGVLKRSGPASEGYLSYLFPGYTLALDFANTGEPVLELFRKLDQILLKCGGRLYLAKDAVANAETMRAMYPRWHQFQVIKRSYDPDGRFSSSQARRLGLEAAA